MAVAGSLSSARTPAQSKQDNVVRDERDAHERHGQNCARAQTTRKVRSMVLAQQVKKALDKRDKAYKEMQARARRAEKLDSAMHSLQHQRNMMGKGAKRKVSTSQDEKDSNSKTPQYKWKRVRAK